jgi:hypothetical protein
LKTETISIKGHEYHSAQSSYQSHDLTYQSFCKTHISHGNNALSSIAETNSRGLDAFISKALSPQSQGLSMYEKEHMAILMAVDHWHVIYNMSSSTYRQIKSV